MSEQEVSQDVKTEAVSDNEKDQAVTSNEKADNYSVPGYRFRELNEAKKGLEDELSNLKAQIKEREVADAEEREDWRNLYEEAKADRDKFKSDAEKFYSIEQSRKERLLESFPEKLREKLINLDSETLEQMKDEFTTKVPKVDASGGGVSGGKVLDWKNLSTSDRKKYFADIVRSKT